MKKVLEKVNVWNYNEVIKDKNQAEHQTRVG